MTAVIVAAGYSSRAKAFKPLLPLGGRTVVEQTISSFKTTCSLIIVVGGYNYSKLKEFIESSEYLNGLDLQILCVYNKNYDDGMFSSIKVGISYLKSGDFFFTPGDLPGVSAESIELLSKIEGDVVLPSYNDKSGHPVKLSESVKQSILESSKGDTLRDILNKFKKNYVVLNDKAVLMDLDTPEDYRVMVCYFDKIKRSSL